MLYTSLCTLHQGLKCPGVPSRSKCSYHVQVCKGSGHRVATATCGVGNLFCNSAANLSKWCVTMADGSHAASIPQIYSGWIMVRKVLDPNASGE